MKAHQKSLFSSLKRGVADFSMGRDEVDHPLLSEQQIRFPIALLFVALLDLKPGLVGYFLKTLCAHRGCVCSQNLYLFIFHTVEQRYMNFIEEGQCSKF